MFMYLKDKINIKQENKCKKKVINKIRDGYKVFRAEYPIYLNKQSTTKTMQAVTEMVSESPINSYGGKFEIEYPFTKMVNDFEILDIIDVLRVFCDCYYVLICEKPYKNLFLNMEYINNADIYSKYVKQFSVDSDFLNSHENMLLFKRYRLGNNTKTKDGKTKIFSVREKALMDIRVGRLINIERYNLYYIFLGFVFKKDLKGLAIFQKHLVKLTIIAEYIKIQNSEENYKENLEQESEILTNLDILKKDLDEHILNFLSTNKQDIQPKTESEIKMESLIDLLENIK